MNILEYALLHGFNPKYTASTDGGEYKGHCPFCGVQKDHCAYWPNHPRTKHKGGSYWCRDCDSKGDLIALIMGVERVGYKEACRIAGQQPKESGGGRYNSPVKSTPARREMKLATMNGGDTWLNSAAVFIDQSCKRLEKKPEALAWLQQSKFLTQKTIARYRLGWNEAVTYVDRNLWGLPEELNDKGRSKKMWLPRGFVIPRYSHDGKLCGIKIRRTNEDLKKEREKAREEAKKLGNKEREVPSYIRVPGGAHSPMLCGKNRSRFIVVESELDAIFLAQEGVGLLSAVSLGSAANWPDQEGFELLKRADKIFLCLDSDHAGKNKKKIEEWLSIFPNASCLYLPSDFGKDATDAAKKGFPIRAWLEEATRRAEAESQAKISITTITIGSGNSDETLPTAQKTGSPTDSEAMIFQAAEADRSCCNQIILAALVLSDKLKTQGLKHEAEQLDILLEVVDRITEAEPQQNMTAALYYLERFLERYRHAG